LSKRVIQWLFISKNRKSQFSVTKISATKIEKLKNLPEKTNFENWGIDLPSRESYNALGYQKNNAHLRVKFG
jgi:hypothetical protein